MDEDQIHTEDIFCSSEMIIYVFLINNNTASTKRLFPERYPSNGKPLLFMRRQTGTSGM